MRNRKKMGRKSSRKSFRRGAKTHKKNLAAKPMRGGWRL